mgnify:CR=1 FL=1
MVLIRRQNQLIRMDLLIIEGFLVPLVAPRMFPKVRLVHFYDLLMHQLMIYILSIVPVLISMAAKHLYQTQELGPLVTTLIAQLEMVEMGIIKVRKKTRKWPIMETKLIWKTIMIKHRS